MQSLYNTPCHNMDLDIHYYVVALKFFHPGILERKLEL